MVTVADAMVESGSVTVMPASTAVVAFSVYARAATVAVTTAASLTAVTESAFVTKLLSTDPSLTWNAIDRLPVPGVLLVLLYVTDRSAVCQNALVATPVSVRVPPE
jgi:hypothetical protein